ncbi:hypothetical protein JOD97_000500 [Duganella sp. 1411]|jgi:hypothetical protein|uniref:choice-of-anchor J domain-containing protein n=1 Tax=Duganella sp. 1411 TaxID=2806572 RepID=UPI001AE6138A|nr:choice-of-anchor J domain-containing protein [Duganella sp. 1411]MBP1202486.1 hypothetical protein [Duganella sp. 1411]
MKLPWLNAAVLAGAALCSHAGAATLSEDFDGGLPAGWTVVNNSAPAGLTSWFQGDQSVFAAEQGGADSYVAANFNSGAGAANLSTWLILPTQTFHNGDVLSFSTRTSDFSFFPDRLEVRFSALGGTNVGSGAASVGDYSTLLLSINPAQQLFGYPDVWTRYSVTLGGLAGATDGALAFRYVVDNGGPGGQNSNYIGIDSVRVSPVPEPDGYLMLGAGLALVALVGVARRRTAAPSTARPASSMA